MFSRQIKSAIRLFSTMAERTPAERFVEFVNKAPTQFHAVAELSKMYVDAGFIKISEKDDAAWKVQPGKKYFFTRNQSCLVAFAVGSTWVPGNGFVIEGAHTDSPVLKLKPVSKITKGGCLQIGVQCYGGGLWNTWWDRDLSVAGRVLVQEGGVVRSRLVRINESVVRIPNLAIHLNRDVNTSGFQFNTETELVPVLATQLKAEVHAMNSKNQVTSSAKPAPRLGSAFEANHHPALIQRIATELNIDVSAIIDFELCLYDTQPAQITGLYNEFVSARALDNLLMSFICSESLIGASVQPILSRSSQIFMTTLFDNEEVGSGSMMGAGSNILSRILTRINGAETLDTAVAKSMLISADMAHALHPNYSQKHEENHRPLIHQGLVIKENSNMRYATNPVTMYHIVDLAKKLDVPLQQFCVRNDSGCGSTIGPILAASCGLRTIDVGVPQWAMHSIRETCGVEDVASSLKLLTAYFPAFAEFDSKLLVDDQ